MYEEKFGDDLKLNTALLKLTEDGKAHEDEVAKDWLKKNDILVVTSTSYVISSFEDIISSLNSVVVLMIICAAALAFVVLYNLTNINVAERMREIATIKVLGFTEKESANYVYRENIVLSVIGIAVGLVMGIFLSNYIVSTIEMDIVMFGHTHRPVIEVEQDITLINPGSISYPRQADGIPTYIMLEIDDNGEMTFNLKYV